MMQSTEAMANISMDPTRIFFLPNLSVRGPMNTCPAANPIIPVVRLSEAKAGEVWKNSDISGSTGR